MKNFIIGILTTVLALFIVASVSDTKIELDGITIYNSSGRAKISAGIEVDSLKFSNGGSIPNMLYAEATLDFSNGAPEETLTMTVTGAAVGDLVILQAARDAMDAGLDYIAWVSSANTVTVKKLDTGGVGADPSSGVFKVYVIER